MVAALLVLNMAVVYQHIRKDNNEIFYIGIGKTEKRAFSKNKRNSHWYNVINKCEYKIEIVYSDLTWNLACQMEKYLIAEYGRDDLGLGALVNKTDGGEGTINAKWSDEYKEKMSKALKGRVFSEEHKRKLKESRKKQSPPTLGKKYSEESKKRMSLSKQKENHPLFGKKYSQEIRNKMSERLKGNTHSLGFKHSEATIKKRRLKRIGKKCPAPIVKCIYCEKEGASRVMTRYHFENCKLKTK